MNDLEKYFRENNKRLIDKWMHYFDIYDRHFKRYRNQEVVILEIGVSHGGSLQMWKDYFGGKAIIYGIDIEPRCKTLEEDNIEIFIGSQSDRKFLREIKQQIPPIDILIDDGGHTMRQQIVSYEELFPHIKENGVYLCEDLHTSYQIEYGGGHKMRGTFIEYSKNFIDYLNAFHSTQKSLRVSDFTKAVDSITYYDSVIVIEKKKREEPPHAEKTGNPSFEGLSQTSLQEKLSPFKGKLFKIKRKVLRVINLMLQRLGIKRAVRIRGIIWKN
jgi:23S rRNA U2552 (ribose-2'-O)-methylase RlmE/FtsJ